MGFLWVDTPSVLRYYRALESEANSHSIIYLHRAVPILALRYSTP
jgi:hypothetical protein